MVTPLLQRRGERPGGGLWESPIAHKPHRAGRKDWRSMAKRSKPDKADRDKRLLEFFESDPRYAPIFREGGFLDEGSRACHSVIGLWRRLFPAIPYSDASLIDWLASQGITPMAAQRMTYFEAEEKLCAATEKTSSLADGGPWSTANTPEQWAKLFKISAHVQAPRGRWEDSGQNPFQSALSSPPGRPAQARCCQGIWTQVAPPGHKWTNGRLPHSSPRNHG